MNFIAPYMLWGALAAGVPVALHFFFRSRYRTVPWAAMKFLLVSVEQTSRRLKFQELLLLLVRCAVLALLALALARLQFSAVGGSERDAVDAVFVIDTSFSMGAREGKQTRLDLAKKAALAVLKQLPRNSTIQVVTCSDRAVLVGPPDARDRDQAAVILKDLDLTHLASDLAPGIAEAVSALKRGHAANQELYVFSDMQKDGWDKNADRLNKTVKDLSETATVHLVRCGTQQPRNVAVVGIAPQSGIPRPGERVGFAVLVRNTGAAAVKNLAVRLTVDGKRQDIEEQPIAELSPGETRTVTLTAKMEKAGLRVLTATVRDDDLDEDNRYDQVILVRDQLRVLVVDGAADPKDLPRSSAFHLEHALVPVKDEQRAKYHVRLTSLSPRRVSAAELNVHDVCILANVALERGAKGGGEAPPSDFVEQLGPFVRRGNGLIIFGGDNVAPEAYNRILGQRLNLLPAKVAGLSAFGDENFVLLDRGSITGPAFLRFREDEDFKGISFVPILRTLQLDEPAREAKKETGGRVLMRYTNGKPALVSRTVGAGEVLLVATSAGPEWKRDTRLPSWNWLFEWQAGYLPLVEAFLNHLQDRLGQSHNFTAGKTLDWHPTPDPLAAPRPATPDGAAAQVDDTRAYFLIHPPTRPGAEARREPLGRPEMVQGRPVVTAAGIDRAGVYHITAADRGAGAPLKAGVVEPAPLLVPFAVVPDLRESANLETLPERALNERLGFTPVHMNLDGRASVAAVTERTNREWTRWLLLAVLGLAAGEAILAWFCGRAW